MLATPLDAANRDFGTAQRLQLLTIGLLSALAVVARNAPALVTALAAAALRVGLAVAEHLDQPGAQRNPVS